MKYIFIVAALFILPLTYAQVDDPIYSYSEEMITSAECLTAYFFITNNENDLILQIEKEGTTFSKSHPLPNFSRTNKRKTTVWLKKLDSIRALDEVYILDYHFNETIDDTEILGYRELHSNEKLNYERLYSTKTLIIQFEYSWPCHNDTTFLIIENTNQAKKILDCSNMVFNNPIFDKLKAKL